MKTLNLYVTRIVHSRRGRHLLFWLAFLLALVIDESSSESEQQALLNIIGRNAITLIAPAMGAYLLNYYLMPRFFQRRKYFKFSLLFVVTAYLLCVLARILNVHLAETLFRQGDFRQESVAEIMLNVEALLSLYFPVIYFIAFAMLFIKQQKAQLEIKERNVVLEKEKAETELNFLKAQIHPHFLFNTLNNLYVLTLKKSEKAPETVIKLSEILDYMLYKGKQEGVPLEQEIRLLDNYIALEQLRYGDHLQVVFNKSVDDPQTLISPLLLLSMVENAFKHGASGQLHKPEIKIDLLLQEGMLYFKVFNTKSELVQADSTQYRKGVGSANVKRQLDLLYPGHSLVISEGKREYLVQLSVNLGKGRPRQLQKSLLESK